MEIKHDTSTWWARLRRNKWAMLGLSIIVLLIVCAVFAPLLSPYDPNEQNLPNQYAKPSREHLLGTDQYGRDVLSRLLYGARISLSVGFISISIALVSGGLIGAVAGYFGGWVDALLMRALEVLMAFPSILLTITFVTVLGPNLRNAMIAIGIVTIPGYARVVRGSVISVKEREFVEAARAQGLTHSTILAREIVPNILSPIIVLSTLDVAGAILDTAALGFLGLGAQPPTAEWGSMLSAAKQSLYNAPWLATYPGIAIMITVLAFNLLGDGLRDALDPRMKL